MKQAVKTIQWCAWVAFLFCAFQAQAAPSKKLPASPPSPPSPTPVLEWLPLSPAAISEFGVEVDNSTVPAPAPQLNELVREEQPGEYPSVAYRVITLRLPAPAFAGDEVEWKMVPLRGARIGLRGVRGDLPAPCQTFQGVQPFPFQLRSQRSRVDVRGMTAVRLNVPSSGLNRVQITATPVSKPEAARSLDFEVPGVIVIDAGHGGKANLVSSDANHGVSYRGALEKDMNLHMAVLTRLALWQQARASGVNLRVYLTRDTDENLTGIDRAAFARRMGADQFLILHFNSAGSQGGLLTRGTTEVQRMQGNTNSLEDQVFANRLIDQAVTAMKAFDPQARKRQPVQLDTAVANDLNLGNGGKNRGVRTAYLELEFIDNVRADLIWNDPFFAPQVRPAVARALSTGLLYDLLDPPVSPVSKDEAKDKTGEALEATLEDEAGEGCDEGDGWLLRRDPHYQHNPAEAARRMESAAYILRGWGSAGRIVNRQGETLWRGEPDAGLYGAKSRPDNRGVLLTLGDGAAVYLDGETRQHQPLPFTPPGKDNIPLTAWHWLDERTLIATSGEWRDNLTAQNMHQPLIESVSLHLYDIEKRWFIPVALPAWLFGHIFHINHVSHDGRIQLFLDQSDDEKTPRDLGWFTIERKAE